MLEHKFKDSWEAPVSL